MKDTGQARIVAIKAELKSLEASIQNWQEKVNVASRKDAEYQTLQGEVKRAQDSYDKQYVRDYLESIRWNKQPPAPALPEEVQRCTSEKYMEAYRLLTGRRLDT